MQNLITHLKKTFDHVVIDSPPVASFTDGVLLSSICDGVVLVIHANECSRKVVMRSQHALEDVGAKILGVVLNRVDTRSPDYYYGYRYYSNYKASEPEYQGNEEAPAA